MSAIFTDASFFGGLVNTNIKANTNTPLDLGQGGGDGGTPPSSAPTVPQLDGTPQTTSIDLGSSIAGITGDQPIDYFMEYSADDILFTKTDANLVLMNDLLSSQGGLTPETGYWFRSVASNAAGEMRSASAKFTTAAVEPVLPSTPPVPVVFGSPTSTSITVSFDVAGITGTDPITYTGLYGPTTGPTDISAIVIPPTTGTVYLLLATDLTPNTSYYFKSVATNAAGSVESAISAEISTTAALL